MTDSTCREALREALLCLDHEIEAERVAPYNASRAKQRVAEQQSALSIFANLQADITEATIASLNNDVVYSITGKPSVDFELPENLRDLQRAEPQARERLRQLEIAATQLDRVAEQAHQAAAAATLKAELAAARVLIDEADQMATELRRLEWLAAVSRQRLLAMSHVWTAGHPLALSAMACDVIREPVPVLPVDPSETTRFTAWLRALMESADALPPAATLPDRPRPPVTPPMGKSIPYLEHRQILADRHNERIANLEKDRIAEQQAALQTQRAAAQRIRETRVKNITG